MTNTLHASHWFPIIDAAQDIAALQRLRVDLLGKRGLVSQALRDIAQLAPQDRRARGAQLNVLKTQLQEALQRRQQALESADMRTSMAQDAVDMTLPVRPVQGRIHPLSQATEEMGALFAALGFAIEDGPDIETEYHNFTALNIPPYHPARQMHDTFYFAAQKDNAPLLLRTHTSPVQIRTMQSQRPPFRFVAPGRVYRRDSDATHTPMFHQIEGLVVDKGINLGHLRWVLEEFLRAFFETEQLQLRFRPSYFPFTEPSFEVDIGYQRAPDGGLQIGKGDSWLEVMGCGMVHAHVLRAGKLSPKIWTGFAFGLGIDRLAMLKYGIADLRQFFDGDMRWIQQYGFSPFLRPNLVAGLSAQG